MSHGHVVPNPDGSRARCGGPTICGVCALEQAQLFSGIQPAERNIPVTVADYKKHLNRLFGEVSLNTLSIQTNTNNSHGHVFRRANGTKETCGGPAVCAKCITERDILIKLIKKEIL